MGCFVKKSSGGSYFPLFLALLCTFSSITSSQVPPKITPVLTEMKLRKGERYEVICSTKEGDMPLNFQWTKNGHSISEGPQSSIARQNEYSSILSISAATEEESGNYTCAVSNVAGSDSLTINLNVLVPPVWIRQPHDVSVTSGSKVVLPCEASSNPVPIVKWRRTKGFNVQQSQPVTEAHWRITAEGSLASNQAKKTDEGFYTCEVSNGVGDGLKKTVRLEIQVPPLALLPGTVETVRKGETCILRCNVSGDSPLTTSWEKGGEELKPDSSKGITLTTTELNGVTISEVTIFETSKVHGGLYTCKVSNNHGQNQKSLRLNVVEPPTAPNNIKCTHIWSRSARIAWSQPNNGGSPIKSFKLKYWITGSEEDGVLVVVDSSQTSTILQRLEPYTKYLLSMGAENEVGISEYSNSLVIFTKEEEPESPPLDIQIEEKGIMSVQLSWKVPLKKAWNGQLLGFYIGYKKASYGNQQSYTFCHVAYNEEKRRQSHVVKGLQKSTSYNLIVKAYTKAGIGPASQQVLVTTSYGETPPSPAVEISSIKYSFIELIINTKRKIPVIDYVIHMKRSGEKWHKIPVTKSKLTTYAVGGLIGGTQYQMYLTARNEYGESGPTEMQRFTTSENKLDAYSGIEDETYYLKLSFIIPVVVSITIIVVLPLVTCCFLQKLSSALLETEGVEARGFTYTSAVPPQRPDLVGPVPSQRPDLVGPVPMRSLPRAPPPPPQPPPPPTAYSTLQTYGSEAEYDDPRYDSVVEEMKNFIGAHNKSKKTTL